MDLHLRGELGFPQQEAGSHVNVPLDLVRLPPHNAVGGTDFPLAFGDYRLQRGACASFLCPLHLVSLALLFSAGPFQNLLKQWLSGWSPPQQHHPLKLTR